MSDCGYENTLNHSFYDVVGVYVLCACVQRRMCSVCVFACMRSCVLVYNIMCMVFNFLVLGMYLVFCC